jgi:peptide chain release factor subunit 1
MMGKGTTLLSLWITPGESLSLVKDKLTKEHGTAANIQSPATAKAVRTALSGAIEKLKLYPRTPANGLVIFSGIVTSGHVVLDIVPPKPIDRKLYLCDKSFDVQVLRDMLTPHSTHAFAILDGDMFVLATVTGTEKTILCTRRTCLPGKTRRGGQSAARIDRNRVIRRTLWVTETAEAINGHLLDADGQSKVDALVIAGKAGMKNQLIESATLSPRLKSIINGPYDIDGEGKNGLSQAIIMSAPSLGNRQVLLQRQAMTRVMSEMAKPDGRWSSSVKDTMLALEQGAVKELLVWDKLPISRCTWPLDSGATDGGKKITSYGTYITNGADGTVPPKEYVQSVASLTKERPIIVPLLEWLTENKFGSEIILISDSTPEGSQLALGLGGMAAVLHYRIDFASLDDDDTTKLETGDFI